MGGGGGGEEDGERAADTYAGTHSGQGSADKRGFLSPVYACCGYDEGSPINRASFMQSVVKDITNCD